MHVVTPVRLLYRLGREVGSCLLAFLAERLRTPFPGETYYPCRPSSTTATSQARAQKREKKFAFIVLEDVKGQTVTIFVSRRTAAVGKGIPAVPRASRRRRPSGVRNDQSGDRIIHGSLIMVPMARDFMSHYQRLAPPSLQIGRSVLEPHDHQVRGRRRERSRRPAQRARYEGSDQISHDHSQPHRKEMEASPQLDLFRMVSEVLRHAPEGQSPTNATARIAPPQNSKTSLGSGGP